MEEQIVLQDESNRGENERIREPERNKGSECIKTQIMFQISLPPLNSIFPLSTHLDVNAMLVTTYLRTFNKDATRAKECAKIPPPPGGKNAKCRILPFKKSNCNIICIN